MKLEYSVRLRCGNALRKKASLSASKHVEEQHWTHTIHSDLQWYLWPDALLMIYYSWLGHKQNQGILNYQLLVTWRHIENAFGFLIHMFRILLNTMKVRPKTAKSITLACIMLPYLSMIPTDTYAQALTHTNMHSHSPTYAHTHSLTLMCLLRHIFWIFGGQCLFLSEVIASSFDPLVHCLIISSQS